MRCAPRFTFSRSSHIEPVVSKTKASEAMPGGAFTFNMRGMSDRINPCICCPLTDDDMSNRKSWSSLRFILCFSVFWLFDVRYARYNALFFGTLRWENGRILVLCHLNNDRFHYFERSKIFPSLTQSQTKTASRSLISSLLKQISTQSKTRAFYSLTWKILIFEIKGGSKNDGDYTFVLCLSRF